MHVSAVGFGCGGLMQSPYRKERMAVLGSAVDNGITHFDTARMYGLGMAEAELGAFLRTIRRDSVTVATKFGIDAVGSAQRFGRFQAPARALLRRAPAIRRVIKRSQDAFATARTYDAATAARSLDQSLTALNVDYIDILFVHAPRPTDIVHGDELRHFFENARQQGKIRAWGVSQDEGMDVDIAGQFGPDGVSQLQGSLLNPAPRSADIAFGVLAQPHAVLSAALRSDRQLAQHWREVLQRDPLASGVLSTLLLASATTALNCRAILYSTTKPHRIAEAAHAVASPPDADVLTRFSVLVEDFRKVHRG
ncbi:MAG: aldo/keto reductase [Mycobacteriaceae bacterium]|nr:aldo/keto reductase [Mycobacteriaceae bacterium]